MATATATTPRLKQRYRDEIVQALMRDRGFANVMQAPTLTKIVVNMGLGEALKDAKILEGAVKDLAVITGQKPLVTKARKSVANFKLREGSSIGAKVTLRGDRMWEFADRLLTIALPRIRDFRGLPQTLDGRGNYTFGVTEQLIFPEVDYDQVYRTRGMHITFVTTAETDEDALALLKALGFPFRE